MPIVGELIVTKRMVNTESIANACFRLLTRPHARGNVFSPIDAQLAANLYTHLLRHCLKHTLTRTNDWGTISVQGPAPFTADWRTDLAYRILQGLCPRLVDVSLPLYPPLPAFYVLHGLLHHNAGFCALDTELDALFAMRARITRHRMNTFHPQAIYVVGIRLYPHPTAWHTRMAYGYEGSLWLSDSRDVPRKNQLALSQRKGESLLSFVRRARAYYESLLLPPHVTACSLPRPVCKGRVSLGKYVQLDPLADP